MIGGNHDLFEEVVRAVESWIPSEAYDHESKFQRELQTYLDEKLNAGDGLGFGLGGGGGERVVETESDRARGDIVVNQEVGIEIKRKLSNSQTKKLRGQIEEYLEEYPFVIVCACGIQDMDGWHRLKNTYSGGGLEIDGGTTEFVYKNPANYGSSSGRSGDDEGLLGDYS